MTPYNFSISTRSVLKQTESHYPYLTVQEEMQSMLNFSQGEDMTLGVYYKKFNTRIAIADCAGFLLVTKSLLDTESEVLFQGTLGFKALQANKKVEVEKATRDKYLAVLYLMRSGKRNLQLQNDIKNDHAKGVENSFLTTVALTMQIMNDFKLVIMESSNQASLGTAFTQGGTAKKQSKSRLTDAKWNALSPEAKSKLIEK